jgi:acyl carrier protein
MNEGLMLPRDLVAKVLGINVDILNDNSACGETPNWDSLNHVDIIYEMESNYGIQIHDDEIEKYMTMKAINELYDALR